MCIFSRERRIFGHEVFFRMYSPLALELYNRLFIYRLGLMTVHKIKKHFLGFTQSKYLLLSLAAVLTSPSWFGEN